MSRASAIIDRLQRGEYQPVVRRAAAREREPGDRECAEHIRIGAEDLFRLSRDVRRVRQRCSRRGLNYGNEVILVFLWNESRGHMDIHESRGCKSRDK